ncbi:MAG: prepilin-type N-terminal cleavage/methylation domain-containing protein [Actinomycetota bacterium]|nr:prepilin-type N-terminal cleavage/methylation domain-containing protein [Actinomycetota bacterium]
MGFPSPGRGRPGRDGGVTIIEMMVAIAIMSVCVLGLTRAATSAGRVSQVAEQRRVAADIAASEIERAWALPYDRLAVAGTVAGPVLDGVTSTADGLLGSVAGELGTGDLEAVVDVAGLVVPRSTERRSGISYEVERLVARADPTEPKLVVVVVSWESATGDTVELRAETRRTDRAAP